MKRPASAFSPAAQLLSQMDKEGYLLVCTN